MPDQPVTEAAAAPPEGYRVLARKYRPASFADLIGQEALVRTLTNAIESGRVAQAFILTGVRGVGKTTTARILARALNCIGPDGNGGPTATPCGVCTHCVAIAQDRHVDVIEMDAASRTGIDDIRELIEGVRYRPVQARTKVYIIDEVHMLSRQAFNGLLKTLEEPPEHVVFIFATTEIRKVPVTVLSRCQRFDLKLVDQDLLTAHFAKIAEAEKVAIDEESLAMIARAADGSVRDGLSLLDQAIALTGDKVEAAQVREMLGLADRARIFDLLESLLAGKAPEALERLGALHAVGADPQVVFQDLLELTHFLTRAKLVPEVLRDPALPETERVRGAALAETLTLASLTRVWQMLLKGLGEVQTAPARLQAAEMVLIRIAYAAELPSPAELVRRLGEEPGPDGGPARGEGAGRSAGGRRASPAAAAPAEGAPGGSTGRASAAPAAAEAAVADPAPETDEPTARLDESETANPAEFAAVVGLARARRETILANHLAEDIHLVRFEPGRIEFRPGPRAPRNLAGRLGAFLQTATGRRWLVSVSQEEGAASLREQERDREAARRAEAMEHPLVQATLAAFPGARIVERRDLRPDPDEALARPPEPGSDEIAPDIDETPSEGDEES